MATVFVVGPANLILDLFKSTSSLDSFMNILSKINLVYIIGGLFIYNFLATLLPIDKVIGRIYPYFGALLIFSAVAMFVSVVFLFPELPKPELNFSNMPDIVKKKLLKTWILPFSWDEKVVKTGPD